MKKRGRPSNLDSIYEHNGKTIWSILRQAGNVPIGPDPSGPFLLRLGKAFLRAGMDAERETRKAEKAKARKETNNEVHLSLREGNEPGR